MDRHGGFLAKPRREYDADDWSFSRSDELSYLHPIWVVNSPYFCTFLTAMIALSFGRWWKIVCGVPFYWGWISIGFGGLEDFFPADSARSSFQPELAIGPLLGPQLKWRSWHPVMVEERRGGWGQCNTHLVAITQKQDGMFFVACFFCIVCYKLSMLHYVAAYANTWLPLGNCVTTVDPSGTSISKSLQLLQTRHCWYCFPPNSHDIRFHVWCFRCVGWCGYDFDHEVSPRVCCQGVDGWTSKKSRILQSFLLFY